MTLAAGLRLGPYEISGPLGAGGMGEVYKASDTRLGRPVALKVLPSHLAGDEERRQRLALEAKAISALSHPNICVLHDVGHQDGIDYLVMEYLEGETLAARLRRGPLPLAEALRLAGEMAAAIDVAHRAGIVHRDLKPGNVMLTKGGAKLMDFGLAKLREPEDRSREGASGDPATVTREGPLTQAGAIVGTIGYIAPEQLQGHRADARTDIFALGVVLYEMLTGVPAFTGTSTASLIASILGSEPRPVSSVEPRCPPALDRVVSACLAKDPDRRWQSAHDLGTELGWIAEDVSLPAAAADASLRGRSRERMAWLAGTALLLGAFAFLAVSRPRAGSVASPPAVRFQVPLPAGGAPSPQGGPALSPKGDRIAFSALVDGRFYIYVRSLESLAVERVRDSEDGYAPFWSPDGREIAFAAGQELKRADLATGNVQSVARLANVMLGGTWSPRGVILFAAGGRLWTVSGATGGEAKVLGDASVIRSEPRFLPDGSRFVFSQADATPPARRDLYVGSLDSGEVRRIVEDGSGASYVRSGACLLFVRGNVLMAQPFDAVRAQVSGTASRASDHASLAPLYNGQSAYSVSESGALAWLSGASADNLQLTWFDRSGRKLGTVGDPGDYSAPALSPDERSLAVSRRDPKTKTRDLWVFDLGRETSRRLTFEPTDEVGAAWSPDGAWIGYSTNPGGLRSLYRRRADGSGDAELVFKSNATGPLYMEDWAPDGSFLLCNTWRVSLQPDILLLPLTGPAKGALVPLLATAFTEQMSQVSPDSRWFAYASNESGRDEVYVQPVPRDGPGGHRKTLVSTAGGLEPRWRKDGGELYYVAGSTLMAVEVKARGEAFEAGTPRRLFDVLLPEPRRNRFVVTRDGRFLVNLALGQTSEPIEMLMNWRPPAQ